MTWYYAWQNTPYDTQRWDYMYTNGHQFRRLGQVARVIRARQSYDEPLHEYQAHAFGMKQKMVFPTRVEAEAWVTACERME
jgi:hypothetical protein